METETPDNNAIGNRPNHPLFTSVQAQNNSSKRTKTATIKAENIANMMHQLGTVSQNGIGFWVGKNPVVANQANNSTDDDPSAFGCLVAHKLRVLSVKNAMCAQTDIITILQKYILAELDEDQ